MSKEDQTKWKNKEKELMAEIKSLQKNLDEISRTVRSKDQHIEKLKSVESKHTTEIDTLKNKLKEAAKKDVSAKLSIKTTSVDNIAKLRGLRANGSVDSDCESVNIPPPPRQKAVPRKPLLSRNELPDNCMHAYRSEKWIGVNGGTVKLPQLHIVIQGQTLKRRTLVAATKIDIARDIMANIELCSLEGVVEPLLQLFLEPYGMNFENEVYLDIFGCVNNPRYRYLVFQKNMDCYNDTEWTEITSVVNPKFQKGSILRLPIHQFANTVILRLDIPVTSFIGNSNQGYSLGPLKQDNNISAPRVYYGGVNTEVMVSILNSHIKKIMFYVYHDIKNKSLNVWAKEVPKNKKKLKKGASLDNDVDNQILPDSHTLMFIDKLVAKFPLCLNDRIYFHLDGHKKWQQMGIIDFEEMSAPQGQLFKVALSVKKSGPPGAPTVHQEKMPKQVTITRRIADRLDAQDVCNLDIKETSMSSEYQMASITTAVIEKVLARVRIRIMRTVDIRYVMEIMRKNEIFTALEQDEVAREKTPYTRAKVFMDYLARKGAKGMMGLCEALETDYVGLAHEIRAILQCNV